MFPVIFSTGNLQELINGVFWVYRVTEEELSVGRVFIVIIISYILVFQQKKINLIVNIIFLTTHKFTN